MENCTALLCEGNHGIFFKFSFVGKDLLEKLDIRGHLRDDIQEWDTNLQLLKHFQKFPKLGHKFGLDKSLSEKNRGPLGLNRPRLGDFFMLVFFAIIWD